MNPKTGLTRTVVRPRYALIARDGYVGSTFPHWKNCTPYVLISSAMGARLVQILVEMKPAGSGHFAAGAEEWFVYVVTGSGNLNWQPLQAGGFGYVPAGTALTFIAESEGAQILIFQKTYEPIPEVSRPAFITGNERDVPEVPFLGDPRARLKTLLPDASGEDMAVNIFTYDPGATLPFVETHIMEHGMLFLGGSGVYRLGDDWHPVMAGDAIWIAPYCPQWFIAAGPEPARYIYYKDVNRLPLA
jgi:(S)-ureidoglycine aminohydrolase